MSPSLLDTLRAHAPGGEVWWDSLPTSFEGWAERLVAAAPPERRAALAAGLVRFWEPGEARGLMAGSTSNPRLVLEALRMDAEGWRQVLNSLSEQHATTDPPELYGRLLEEMFRRNARELMPLWERTEGRQGWLCVQLLPSASFDLEAMVAQGRALAAVSPNLMIKVVGSEQGYQAIERLTSLGIATNCTWSFSMAQVERGLEALAGGLSTARREGVDLTRWRAVLTHMMGRVGAETELEQQAESRGLLLSPDAIRWAEVIVARRLFERIARQSDPIRLLLCSLKMDPWREAASAHFERTLGMECVYTLPPGLLSEVLTAPAPVQPDVMPEPVPPAVLNALSGLPYFVQVATPGAIPPAEFAMQPAFLRALQEANAAYRESLDWIRLSLVRKEALHA